MTRVLSDWDLREWAEICASKSGSVNEYLLRQDFQAAVAELQTRRAADGQIRAVIASSALAAISQMPPGPVLARDAERVADAIARNATAVIEGLNTPEDA